MKPRSTRSASPPAALFLALLMSSATGAGSPGVDAARPGTDGLPAGNLYWKAYNSNYLMRTDKEGRNLQVQRVANWRDQAQDVVGIDPRGNWIVEFPNNNPYIRKHNAITGGYVDILTDYALCGYAAGVDSQYIYRAAVNYVYKFRLSDGAFVNVTYLSQTGSCYNFGVANDTCWWGDGYSTLYAYPTSWMDGGSHGCARAQYTGAIGGQHMNITWDGSNYFLSTGGTPSTTMRKYDQSWSSYTDYLVGVDARSVLAVALQMGDDVGVSELIAPSGVVKVGDRITPSARVMNFGSNNQGSFNVILRFPGYSCTRTVPSLGTGDTLTVRFDTVTLNRSGFRVATCSTMLAGDQDPVNDRQEQGFVVANFVEGFESGSANYTAIPDSGGWAWGSPTNPRPAAHSGAKVWGDRLSGFYAPGENSGLVSPGLKALVDTPIVAFHQWYYCQSRGDGMNCSYALVGDTTWNLLMPWNSPPYYGYVVGLDENGYSGSVTGWTQANFRVPVDSGTEFRFRWRFAADATEEYYGFTIDDVSGVGCRRLHDVTAARLVAPVGTVDSGAPVTPRCWLRNLSGIQQTFNARLKVGAAYTDVRSVTIPPSDSVLQSFTPYTQLERGTLAVQCSTMLDGDELPANDRVQATLDARVRDAAALLVLVPPDTVVRDSPFVPAARFRNCGTTDESLTCGFRLDDGYVATAPLSLAAGRESTVVFRSTAVAEGNRTAKAFAVFPGDMARANDTVTHRFVCLRHDVGAQAVLAPEGEIPQFRPVRPRIRLKNYGGFDEAVTVHFQVNRSVPPGAVYHDSAQANLPARDSLDLYLPTTWVPADTGAYECLAYTVLAGEQVPGNDSIRAGTHVRPPYRRNAAVVEILQPDRAVDTISPLFPSARVQNLGEHLDDFVAFASISNRDGETVYADSLPVEAIAAGALRDLDFAEWRGPRRYGSYVMRCSLYAADDEDPGDNSRIKSFRVLARVPDGWLDLARIPGGSRGKPVKDGGALVYFSEADSDDRVYALKGNNLTEFYRYDVRLGVWSTDDSIPRVGRLGRRKGVKKGASLTAVTDRVYALKGNRSNEFYQFNPDVLPGADNWTELPSLPGVPVKDAGGLAGVVLTTGGYVYDLKGSGTTEFWRYDVAAGIWEAKKSAPTGASGKTWKAGSCLTTDGVYVYALKGNYNEFYAYDIAVDSWLNKPSLPLVGVSGRKKKVKDGAGLAVLNGIVYALKGGNTRELWRFQDEMWVQEPDMPIFSGKNVKNGGALTASPDALFALKGNGTFEFYAFGPPAGLTGAARRPTPAASTTDQDLTAKSWLSIAPNPFRGASRVSYSLPKAGNVSVKLYDVTGTLVRTLAEGSHEAGVHTATLDASRMARGIYVLKLESDGYATTAKLIIE